MNHLLKRIRTAVLITIIVEALIFTGLAMLDFYDAPRGFNSFMTSTMWVIVCGSFIFIDFILFWIGYLSLKRVRRKSDLRAAELIGGDVQEAYNFGQIGLLVVDNKGQILWTSNLFTDRSIDIVDSNVFQKFPDLKDIKNGTDDVAKLTINERSYDVKYLSDAQLFIFKDSTEYDSLYKVSKQQSLVVGMVLIDNFNDLMTNEDENNELFVRVRQVIQDYAKEHDVLLKKIRNDTYLAICNCESLTDMIEDRFSLLNEVKECQNQDYLPTLSVGFAYDFPDANKLNEMASNALDVALSRGGDQAVVAKYGDDLLFFGGVSVAKESSSKVQSRSIADSIISLIKNSENVYIMGHSDMDMDSLGASLGMKAMCDWFKKPAWIVADFKSIESKTKGAIYSTFNKTDIDRLFVSPKEACSEVNESSLIIVVDVSNPLMVMSSEILDKSSKVVIVDHHRRGENFIEHPVLSFIQPSASSASELVTEFLKYATANPKIEINEKTATIMLSGIFLDTNFFKAKTTGRRTFEAAEYLKQYGADNGKADEFLKEEFEEYTLINQIITSIKTPFYGVAYCVAPEGDLIEKSTLAKVANTLMQLKGVNACFVIGKTDDDEIRVSARSDGTINVQLLTEKLGGGGHYTSAAASFKDQNLAYVESQLLETLEVYLNASKNVGNQEE